ncbi:hypothetical protein OC834_005895 [Tilletia horrida]|nr:hypothetical protein OC834_005895 [Tilletia horrida]
MSSAAHSHSHAHAHAHAHGHTHAATIPAPPRKHAHGRTPSTVPTLITPVPTHSHSLPPLSAGSAAGAGPGGAPISSPVHTHAHSHAHAPHSHAHSHAAPVTRHAHKRTFSSPLALHLLPPHLRPQLIFALAHLFLGGALWVSGQARDSLAVTGLGYLVVFDALGVLNPVAAAWMTGLEGARRRRKAEEKALSNPYGAAGPVKEGDVRRPYGAHRTSTLLHFTQSIYLLFAALYVCKESVEHALLHPSGGMSVAEEDPIGSHPGLIHTGDHDAPLSKVAGFGGEHVHDESMSGIELPIGLLVAATLASMYANLRLGNHARLMAACGMSTTASSTGSAPSAPTTHNRHRSVLFDPAMQATRGASALLTTLLSNPFSLTVLFFSGSLTFASLTMPGLQVAALDKVLAGLESVSMGWLAWPASLALGKVLLQTAPDASIPNEQRRRIESALREIEGHALVSYVAPIRLWQLTPPTSSQIMLESSASRHMHSASVAVSPLNRSGGHGGRMRGGNGDAGGGGGVGGFGMVQMQARTAPLILTVEILLDRTRAKPGDCLEVTRWAYDLLAPCVGAAWGVEVGMVGRGGVRAGEVVVKVRREGKEQDEIEEEERQAHAHEHGCGHDHDHGHGHGHGHGHDHDHGHGHGHHNHHDHSHGHSHGHGHDHSSHSHAHEYSHGHVHDHSSHSHGKDHSAHSHAHEHSHGHVHDHSSHSHGKEHSSHSQHTHEHSHGHSHGNGHGHGHGHGHDHSSPSHGKEHSSHSLAHEHSSHSHGYGHDHGSHGQHEHEHGHGTHSHSHA